MEAPDRKETLYSRKFVLPRPLFELTPSYMSFRPDNIVELCSQRGSTFSYEYDIPEAREDYLEEGDSGVAEEGQCDEDFPYEDGHDEYGEYV